MRHSRSIGVLALGTWLLGGCGGQASSPRPETAPPTAPLGSGTTDSPPEAAPGAQDRAASLDPVAAEPGAPEPGAPEPRIYLPQISAHDLRAQAIAWTLDLTCPGCYETRTEAPTRIDTGILTWLLEHGEIVPGDSGGSPFWLRMRDGAMPPGASRRLTSGELTVLADFIDGLPTEPDPSCAPLPFLSSDDVLETLLQDLNGRSNSETTRYVSLTYASNAGVCGRELERQRSALFKGINSVSTGEAIVVPEAVDDSGLLYRIDLRDYAWVRPLDLEDDGQPDYNDAWLALVAALGVLAPELAGPEADALKAATGTAVPLLPAHGLVHAVANGGDLYHSLLGARANGHDTRLELGVDIVADLEGNDVQRAGFVRQGNSQSALIARFEQNAPASRSYWLLQEQDPFLSSTVFDDPLGLPWRGGLSIQQLPNGMLAYGVESAEGWRLSAMAMCVTLDICEIAHLGSFAACHACHESGQLPVTDMMRSFVEENVSLYDAETLRDVREQYPGADGLSQLLSADRELARASARAARVSVGGGPELLSYVHSQFENELLDVARVAAELSVAPGVLREQLGNLSPQWQVLVEPGGTIDRFALTSQYTSAACTLHASARNRPVSCP